MPNWVYNGLTAEGPKDAIDSMIAQVGKSFTLPMEVMDMGDISGSGFPTKIEEVVYTNPIFSFFNIIAPTDLDAYAKQPPRYDSIQEAMQHKSQSWYDFNNREWGVKWDVAVSDTNKYPETYMEGPVQNDGTHPDDPWVVYYNFNTPWGIPDEALIKLSSQYPTILFTLSYEEETGWGGEHEYLRGERLEGSEYNWKCRECDYAETDEPPYCEECEYDMCPKCGFGEPDEPCDTHKKELTDVSAI